MSLERTVEGGIGAGILSALPALLFWTLASLSYQGDGLFTPMYRVSAILQPSTLRASVDQAMAGDPYYFVREPFVFGLFGCFFIAGVWGGVFGVIARTFALQGGRAFALGIGYALALMILVEMMLLPFAGTLSRLWAPIDGIASDVGWFTFTINHLIFGAGLGWWAKRNADDLSASPRLSLATPGEPGAPSTDLR